MLEKIKKCQKCELYKNQCPLMDKKSECQIIWVGLSAKIADSYDVTPLSSETKSGMLIKAVEDECEGVATYKTNLVKCPPITYDHKLRYPDKKEIDCCFDNLLNEIQTLHPKIVILLGEKVYDSVGKHLHIHFEKWTGYDYHYAQYGQIFFIPIQHPSYIYVYKRKEIDEYVHGIKKIVYELLDK